MAEGSFPYEATPPFGTPRHLVTTQRTTRERVAELLSKGKTHREIAEALKVSRGTVSDHARVLKVPLAPVPDGFEVAGIATKVNPAGHTESQWIQSQPEGHVVDTVPTGHIVKGLSTLVDQDGKMRAQWIKTREDDPEAQLALMRAAIETLAETAPRIKPVIAPKRTERSLCNLYTITDAHVGLHSWAAETGVDWDLSIAENVIGGCFEQMIAGSPAAEVGIVNQLGDFLHTDSFKALTPASGNILDADSRYQKIVQVAVRVLRRMVSLSVAKHKTVIVNMMDANHDPVGGTWLRVLFAALYENEPRVTVNTSPSPYVAHQHGKTMLAFHHGHGAKKANLPLLFASRFSEMWGATAYRYCHTGHLHHVDEKEHPGMTVVQHPTLAAPDSYASRGGWDSQRVAQAIFYHDKHGQVGRNFVTPEMLAA